MPQYLLCSCGNTILLGTARCPKCGKSDPTGTRARGDAERRSLERSAQDFHRRVTEDVDGKDEVDIGHGSVLRRVSPGVDQWEVARKGDKLITSRKVVGSPAKETGENSPRVTPDPCEAALKDKDDREKIKDLVEKIISNSKDTKHKKSDVGDTVMVYDDTLHVGDFELNVNIGIGDAYCHHSVKAKYKGKEVFADRSTNSLFVRGDWEALLAELGPQVSP